MSGASVAARRGGGNVVWWWIRDRRLGTKMVMAVPIMALVALVVGVLAVVRITQLGGTSRAVAREDLRAVVEPGLRLHVLTARTPTGGATPRGAIPATLTEEHT